MFLNYCPYCDSILDADTEIYIREGRVLGCEYCVRQTWADFEEEDREELEADAADFEYHSAKEEAYCDRQEALLRGCF